MKRTRSKTLFFWKGEPGETSRTNNRKKYKQDNDSDNETGTFTNGTQIELILKSAPHYENSIPLPYEMLMKIFMHVVELSDHPLRDLCSLARVCETWRQMVIQSPALWSRIDLTKLPITDRNILTLRKIFQLSPSILVHVKEVALSGVIKFKNNIALEFIETLSSAPNLETLTFRELRTQSKSSTICRSISRSKNLHSLSITQSKSLFNNQKWLADYLLINGQQLEVLDLAMSLTSISSQLFKAIGSEYCPKLRVLDISTCDCLSTHSFDAIQLTQNMPNLEVLRVGNVSFKRVYSAPEVFGLKNIRELSMPIGMRDADRDDALFATLTFGSHKIKTLDLRGASISAFALIDMPSYEVKELHMDDLCPLTRKHYHRVIERFSGSLEVLSLVKINCSDTIKRCLLALCNTRHGGDPKIRELDLSSSDVTPEDLREFLKRAKNLTSINLTSCRSLPRGTKGLYSRKPIDQTTQKLISLKKKLN